MLDIESMTKGNVSKTSFSGAGDSPFFESNYELRDAQREIEQLQSQLKSLSNEMEQDKKDLKTMEFINDDLEKRLEAEARSRMIFQKAALEEKNELLNKIKAIEAERDIGRLKSIEERRHSESIGARLERTQKDLLAMHNRKFKMNRPVKHTNTTDILIGKKESRSDLVVDIPSSSSSSIPPPDNYVATQLRERLTSRESLLENLTDFFFGNE